jgi:hypothetical protein
LALAAGDRARIDAKMAVGQTTEKVEVSASVAPQLETDSSSDGTLISHTSVDSLPLNGRNMVNLIQLSAGVNEGAQNATGNGTTIVDRRLTSAYSANGQGSFANNNMIDGMDNNERFYGTIVVKPSIDAIQEVNVMTNLYPAEIGRVAGAVADIITKSGTNSIHGTVFEFLRNDMFDANNFFSTTSDEMRQNQFGASIGGPIRKNKTFYFGDYENFRQVEGQAYTANVPTLAQEQAVDADEAANIAIPASVLGTMNAIAPSQFSPMGYKFFEMFPAPNVNGAGYNYASSPRRTQYSTTFDGRVDQHF